MSFKVIFDIMISHLLDVCSHIFEIVGKIHVFWQDPDHKYLRNERLPTYTMVLIFVRQK